MTKQKRWEEYSEQEILQANIEKYNNEAIVKFYEDFEEPKHLYLEYRVMFNSLVKMLNMRSNEPISAVDMCGGAGKAAFALYECSPTSMISLVDVSDKMLEIAQKRAERENIKNIIPIQADAFSFLEQEGEYDLIIFSSAIHHFKDPVNLINLASQRLSEHGLILTIADPNTITKSKRYKFLEFMVSSREAKKNKLKSCFNFRKNKDIAASVDADFDLAEYQTYTGIDDIALRNRLMEVGLNPFIHLRYPAGEPYMTKIMPYLGLYWAFSMIICKNVINEYEVHKDSIRKELVENMPFKFKFMM
ncbi:MAG: methyltransferase domain-containing protein [Syntrophomonadaceae bacterium]|nr:methyltransferase domain-containing protein [Syntrophomonadaceae bacterium]